MFAVSPDWVTYSGRTRVLQAAWDALVETDAYDLKPACLARHVGVSPQAVHKHFPQKVDLLAAVAGAGLATLIVNLDGPSEPMVADFVLAWVRFAYARPRHYALMFSYEFRNNHGVEFRRAALERMIGDLLVRAGHPNPDEALVATVFAMIHGAASLAAAGMSLPSIETLTRVLERLLAARPEAGAVTPAG